MEPQAAPPPLPPQSSFSRWAVIVGLVAPLIAVVLVLLSWRASAAQPLVNLIVGAACGMLLLVGLGFTIAVFAGVHRDGTRGVLGKAIAAAVINGLLLVALGIGFVNGFNRALRSQEWLKQARASSAEMTGSMRRSFDPEKGITNTDVLAHYDRMQRQLQNASQDLSGNDAILAKAMQAHVGRFQAALQQYQSEFQRLKDARVLGELELTNRSELAPRRELVQQFLAANSNLKRVITNSESALQQDLVRMGLAPELIDKFMTGFRTKSVPINSITCRIRDCDDQLGEAMLGALDVLDAQWGSWRYDATAGQIHFDDATAREDYGRQLQIMRMAAKEQVALQKDLVSLQ